MSESRPALAAALLLDFRTPLARVALAASQLERESLNSAARALVAGISDAVAQIDAGIDRALPLLIEVARRPGAQQPLADVIATLLRRLSPGLAARGVALEVDDAGFEQLQCDPHPTRRALAALLQAGGAWLGRGGTARLTLARTGEDVGLRLDCSARDPDFEGDASGLGRLEARCGEVASVEQASRPGSARATLWLKAEATCVAC